LGKFETHQPKPFFAILTTVTIAYDMVWFTALRILQHRGQNRANIENIYCVIEETIFVMSLFCQKELFFLLYSLGGRRGGITPPILSPTTVKQ